MRRLERELGRGEREMERWFHGVTCLVLSICRRYIPIVMTAIY